MKRIVYAIGVAWLVIGVTAGALAAEVTAVVDRNDIIEGETVTLVLQTGDPEQSLTTDMSALESDFTLLDQRSESRMSIVNGRQEATIRLVLTLEPLRTGNLVIPALAFEGGARTAPIPVRVGAAPVPEPGEMPPVFIELELEPSEGPWYVLAQASLTVRIFYQQNLTEAAINPPSPEQASVLLLDEVPYQSTRNGTRYRVLERRYAVFPERSGELTIPPMTLSGRLIERPDDRLWQPQVRGRRVRIESEPLTLQVSPRPADYAGEHWLPARRLTLSQQITDAENLQVGEPVTRTLIIDAVGLDENMIEEPTWPAVADARIYPDQPQGIRRDDGQWLLGHKEFRYAVVPEKAGELVLPEVRLDWWDTVNNVARTAVIPEHRIPVAASQSTASLVTPLTPAMDAAGSPAGFSADPAAVTLWRSASAVLGLLWLVTLVLYLRKGTGVAAEADTAAIPAEEKALLEQFKQACRDADASLARQLLGSWVRRYGPRGANGSVMEFARHVGDDDLRALIYRFDAASFSSESVSGWDGKRLWKAFDGWLSSRHRARPEAGNQPDLYARAR